MEAALIRTLDLRDDPQAAVRDLPRASLNVTDARTAAAAILDDVRERGHAAVLEATERFDGVPLDSLRVPSEAIEQAWNETAPELQRALAFSIERVRRGHEAQLPVPREVDFGLGSVVRQTYVPVQRVGLYAPGGLAAYASSVIMNVVPAQVAGVPTIAVASPPRRDTRLPAQAVLAACYALGVTEVWAMGGAQAVGAFAYGLPSDRAAEHLEPVDVVTGPGNVFVAAAKSLVRGSVGIDAEAGPTEILIVADDSADARFVAADLLSQAEHDPLAACVLVTDSPELAQAVQQELAVRLAATQNSERATQALAGEQSMIVLTANLDDAIALANRYGAEHLELMTEDPRAAASRITHAGAVFLGPWSPVSVGDYAAGSNHVLPTTGTARHASGLSVLTFLRPVQHIEYSQAGLREVAESVVALAQAEGLPAHGEALTERLS